MPVARRHSNVATGNKKQTRGALPRLDFSMSKSFTLFRTRSNHHSLSISLHALPPIMPLMNRLISSFGGVVENELFRFAVRRFLSVRVRTVREDDDYTGGCGQRQHHQHDRGPSYGPTPHAAQQRNPAERYSTVQDGEAALSAMHEHM